MKLFILKEHTRAYWLAEHIFVYTHVCDRWKSSWTAYSNQLKNSSSFSILSNNIDDNDHNDICGDDDDDDKRIKSITEIFVHFIVE